MSGRRRLPGSLSADSVVDTGQALRSAWQHARGHQSRTAWSQQNGIDRENDSGSIDGPLDKMGRTTPAQWSFLYCAVPGTLPCPSGWT